MRCALRGIKFVLVAAAVVAGLGFVVQNLWNWLLPGLFGLRAVTYGQAVGLLILAKILFGGFRGRPGMHGYWRHRMQERWEQMSPEEREKFRAGLGGHCGLFGHHEPEDKTEGKA